MKTGITVSVLASVVFTAIALPVQAITQVMRDTNQPLTQEQRQEKFNSAVVVIKNNETRLDACTNVSI